MLRYKGKLARQLSSIVRDYGAIDDVVQDTFISAYKALRKFRGESEFYTWLYRIGINTAKNYFVAAGRLPLALTAVGLDDDATDRLLSIGPRKNLGGLSPSDEVPPDGDNEDSAEDEHIENTKDTPNIDNDNEAMALRAHRMLSDQWHGATYVEDSGGDVSESEDERMFVEFAEDAKEWSDKLNKMQEVFERRPKPKPKPEERREIAAKLWRADIDAGRRKRPLNVIAAQVRAELATLHPGTDLPAVATIKESIKGLKGTVRRAKVRFMDTRSRRSSTTTKSKR